MIGAAGGVFLAAFGVAAAVIDKEPAALLFSAAWVAGAAIFLRMLHLLKRDQAPADAG